MSRLIDAEKANYPITWMCRQLGVSRLVLRLARPGRARDRDGRPTARLAELIGEVFHDSRGTSAAPGRGRAQPRGHPASVGLVADLMRELGLAACQPRACKTTTIPGEQPVDSPDLIEREFTAPAPRQRLVTAGSTPPCIVRASVSPRSWSARSCVSGA